MKINFVFSKRRSLLAGAALLLLAIAPSRVQAAFILTLTQSGGNVAINGSGTLNTTALTLSNTGSTLAQVFASYGIVVAGPTAFTNYSIYSGGGLTGPTMFGAGGQYIADSGTGSLVGIRGNVPFLFTPLGYTSGSLLTDSATINNATFASIGFTPGSYIYTWGTGANADSLTVTGVVPEPSTWVLFIAGGLLLLCVAFRYRRA